MTLIIDVREPNEFKQEHVPNSINIPLSEFGRIDAYLPILSEKEPLLMCRSGMRAGKAQAALSDRSIVCSVYPGGIQAWKNNSNPVVKSKNRMPLFRQIKIVVGALVVILSVLGWGVSPYFYLGAGMMGGGLFLAGVFDVCLLGILLSKMPWNRV